MADYNYKIVIAGAGMAGLSAGVCLRRMGYTNITFIEASDRPGGRMKTEKINGYSLDNGPHTFFTAYPMAQELLDYEKLDLKYFNSGAIVMKGGRLKRISSPFERSLFGLNMFFSKVGSWADKSKIMKRRVELKMLSESQVFEKFEVKTLSILKKKKFSSRIIKDFFQPFFSTLFFENDLTTSRRIFDLTFKMLTDGRMALPAKGIEAIPQQLASHFQKDNFIFNAKALEFKSKQVEMDNGKAIPADIFIVATEQNSLYLNYKNAPVKKDYRSVTCLYFASDEKPFKDPMICVNGNDPKLVSGVTVLTNISPDYAPKGKELIAVSLNGLAKVDDIILENEVREELKATFGSKVFDWKLLKIYHIDYALPNQDFVLSKRQMNEFRLGKFTYVCGDHLLYGSINAAMKTGKMVAEIVHKDFNQGHKIEKKKKYDSIFDEME